MKRRLPVARTLPINPGPMREFGKPGNVSTSTIPSRAAFRSSISVTGGLYPVQFIQTPQAIVILLESRHNWRYIPLNVPHNPDLDPSWMGASVGRWEGNTLVVDITNFKERLVGSEISTDALRIVERFTRVDYNTIDYEARVEDSKALTRPYTITSKYMLRPGTVLQEYVCEDNEDPAHFDALEKKGLMSR